MTKLPLIILDTTNQSCPSDVSLHTEPVSQAPSIRNQNGLLGHRVPLTKNEPAARSFSVYNPFCPSATISASKAGKADEKNQRIYNHIYMQLFPEIEHETSQYIHRCDTNKCAIPQDLTWDCCINCNFYNHQQLHLKNIPSSNQTWPRMAMNPIICSH